MATDLSDFLNPAQAVKAGKIHDSMAVADFGVGAGFFTRALARSTQGVRIMKLREGDSIASFVCL